VSCDQLLLIDRQQWAVSRLLRLELITSAIGEATGIAYPFDGLLCYSTADLS
jgi:hypothetical protein